MENTTTHTPPLHTTFRSAKWLLRSVPGGDMAPLKGWLFKTDAIPEIEFLYEVEDFAEAAEQFNAHLVNMGFAPKP
jgi:hypothetical protein